MPTNLNDPKSGQTYFQAMTQLATLMDFSGVYGREPPEDSFLRKYVRHFGGQRLHRYPGHCEGLPGAQQCRRLHKRPERHGYGQRCSTTGSTFSATTGKISQVGCGVAGTVLAVEPAVLRAEHLEFARFRQLPCHAVDRAQAHFDRPDVRPQLYAVQVDRHRIACRSGGSFSGDFMINSWNAQQLRAVSRYDTLHQVNAYIVWELPIGRNRHFGSGMNKIAGCVRRRLADHRHLADDVGAALPVSDGSRWATNWELSANATPNGIPFRRSPANTTPRSIGAGAANLWADPKAALASSRRRWPARLAAAIRCVAKATSMSTPAW